MKPPRLTNDQARKLQRAAQCQDCGSRVRVDKSKHRCDVWHDETCPTLRELMAVHQIANLLGCEIRWRGPAPYRDDGIHARHRVKVRHRARGRS